jgi:hypothetical protein
MAVAGLLLVLSRAASLGSLPIGHTPLDGPTPTPTAAQSPPAPVPSRTTQLAADSAGMPTWATTALSVLCLTVVAVAVIALLASAARSSTRFRRRLVRPATRPLSSIQVAEEEVVAALEAGLLDLDDEDVDPRTAVIACWVRLEQAAAGAGVPRQSGDTSTDLVVRMLAQHSLSTTLLTGLADVYRLARYATHQVDADMRDQAGSALRRLRTELTGPQLVSEG